MDGDTGLEGRVEICMNGVWGATRSYTITDLAARVICTQLGHPSECEHTFKYNIIAIANCNDDNILT